MKEKKVQIPIEADVKTKLSGLDEIVKSFNSKLKELKIDPSKNSSFSSLFKNYRKAYEDFEQYVQGNSIDLINAPKAVKSGQKVLELFEQIRSRYGSLTEMSLASAKNLFPEAFSTRAKEAAKAIKTYENATENLSTKQVQLDGLNQKLSELQTRINKINGTRLKAEVEVDLKNAREEADKANSALESFYERAQQSFAKKERRQIKEVDKFTQEDSDFEIAQYKLKREREKAQSEKSNAEFKAETEAEITAIKKRNSDKIKAYNTYQKQLAEVDKIAAQKVKKVQSGDTSKLTKKQREEYEALKNAADNCGTAIKDLEKEQKKAFETDEDRASALAKTNQELAEAKDKYDKLNKEVEKLAKAGDIEGLFNQLKELNIPTDGIEHTLEGVQQLKARLDSLDEATLKRIKEALKSMGAEADNAEDFVDELRKTLGKIDDTEKDINRATKEMEELKDQVLAFFSIGNAVEIFKNAIRDAFDTIKELDAVMTEAAVVTDFSVGDMWDKLPQYTEEANKLGVAIKDLYSATTLYYQQGLNSTEATELGIETLKMAKIANMEASEATQAMTAALRGFNMEVNGLNATRVNDVYSKLAAVTAADTSQIATAMSKTASIASAANMEFEATAAFLSQIIETTQEAPETAGTALKTIIARFSEVKKLAQAGQAAGTDEEGEEIDVNKIETALRMVGVSMDDFFAGTEGLDSILLKLSANWSQLDFETQRYVATMAAGSRQQSRFLAMMGDYGRTMELVEAANNSAGASQQQFDKTMESLESKLQRLENAWNEFVMNLTNSDIIKGVVDLLTKFLEGVNNLTDSIAGDNGIIKSIITFVELIGSLSLGFKVFNGIFKTEKIVQSVTILEKLSKIKKVFSFGEGGGINKVVQTITKIPKPLGAIVAAIAAIIALIADFNSKQPQNKIKNITNKITELNQSLQDSEANLEQLNTQKDLLLKEDDQFDKLIEGTKAWRDALVEANNEILNLIENFPILADYVLRDESGKLYISEEGWEVAAKESEGRIQSTKDQKTAAEYELNKAKSDEAFQQFMTSAGLMQEEEIKKKRWQGESFWADMLQMIVLSVNASASDDYSAMTEELKRQAGLSKNELETAYDEAINLTEESAWYFAQSLYKNNISLSAIQQGTDEYKEVLEFYSEGLRLAGEEVENAPEKFEAFFNTLLSDPQRLAWFDNYVSSVGVSVQKEKEKLPRAGESLTPQTENISTITQETDNWNNNFDKLYNLISDIESETRQQERIEQRYQNLIESVDSSISDIIKATQDQIDILEKQSQMQNNLKNRRLEQISLYQQENQDLSKYGRVETDEYGSPIVKIDWQLLEQVTDEALGQRIEEYLDQLEEWTDSIYDIEKEISNIDDSLDEIKERGKDEYFELENSIKDAIVNQRENEIAQLENINTSITETNSNILDSIKNNLNEQRKNRQNQKTEDNIANKQRRLAYLQQDTSGTNNLEILKLQEELQNEQQGYIDSLIDDKIEQLQEQNDKAAEQRERQISIAKEQLKHTIESGDIWTDVYSLMEGGIDQITGLVTGSELESLLKERAGFEGMSKLDKMQWLEGVQLQITKAVAYMENQEKFQMNLIDSLSSKNNTGNNINTGGANGGEFIENNPSNKIPKEYNAFVFGNFGEGNLMETCASSEEEARANLLKMLDEAEKREYEELEKKYTNFYGGNSINKMQLMAEDREKIKEVYEKARKGIYVQARYKSGGLADFTGPAWLDGTKSRPEYVLNAGQTERFFKLVDILDGFKSNLSNTTNSQSIGATTYDIDINIESVREEADVDMIVEKVQKSIAATSKYRNNNFIKR